MDIVFSETQKRRLRELGATGDETKTVFATGKDRDHGYQATEKRLVKSERQRLHYFCNTTRRSRVTILEQKLASELTSAGFVQVTSPILMSRSSLARMGTTADHPLFSQIFWLDDNRCLRPMLAPHLYEVVRELLRLNEGLVRLFEIGPCFRKESHGARHSNEFTMLNLAEFGLPEAGRRERIEELAAAVMHYAGIIDYEFAGEDSEIYGETMDVVAGKTGMELGSSAMGPHPLDANWRINTTWVGVGFGIERLVMAGDGETNMGRLARSFTYLDGIRLNI